MKHVDRVFFADLLTIYYHFNSKCSKPYHAFSCSLESEYSETFPFFDLEEVYKI